MGREADDGVTRWGSCLWHTQVHIKFGGNSTESVLAGRAGGKPHFFQSLVVDYKRKRQVGKSVGETTRAGSTCSDWHRLDSTIRYGADLLAGNTVALDGDEQRLRRSQRRTRAAAEVARRRAQRDLALRVPD